MHLICKRLLISQHSFNIKNVFRIFVKMSSNSSESLNNDVKTESTKKDIADTLIDMKNDFIERLNSDKIGFQLDKNKYFVYNPLEYASEIYESYVKKYCNTPKKVLFLGMNPGPFGMCQTGVPFGEIDTVRNYLKLDGKVSKPEQYSKVREVWGLSCPKSEVSGNRLWGLIKELSNNDPEIFFNHCFVYNHCPLAIFEKNGKNVTPTELKSGDRSTLNLICDEFLSKVIKLLQIEVVIGIGRYAEERAKETLKTYKIQNVQVIFLTHPSPRNKGSKDWKPNARNLLAKHNITKYMKIDNDDDGGVD